MWKEKCLEEGITERRIKICRGSLKGKKGSGLGVGSSWKAAFLRQVRIETNWRTGSKKPSKVSLKLCIFFILWSQERVIHRSFCCAIELAVQLVTPSKKQIDKVLFV